MLPKLSKVQNAMINMVPVEFEELVRFVLESIYKHNRGFYISHSGKTFAKDHPAAHPVDIEVSFIDDSNSLHHIFVAVSNQKTNLYSNKGKLQSDCDSILKYIVDNNIDNVEIIAVYVKSPSEIDYSNYVTLKDKLHRSGVELSLINAETLNVKINEYCPSVYKQFLNLDVYSGGISYLEEYTNNKLDDSYKHELLGRDVELKELKEKLASNRVVLIRGQSGCGKTRLAIELAKTTFSSNYKCLWVESFNMSSIEDLDYFYDRNENIVILIDDINKISFLNELLNKILQYKNTYVIMTIRDYLFDDYKRRIDLKYFDYQLKNLEPSKIKDILRELFNVNDKFLDYVLLITRNNLRFSIMASKVLAIEKKTPKSIDEIFDAYYRELLSKTGINDNDALKRTIVALSFFDSIDLRSDANNKSICSSFGIPSEDFLEMCEIAHEKEIADFYFDRMFIKISDQIFAEYLFYKYVFVFRKIDIFDLFITYRKTRKQKFIQIIKALINVYYSDENFNEQLKVFEDKVIATNDEEIIISFFSIFAKLFPEDSINYSYKLLKKCNCDLNNDPETIIKTEAYRDLCNIFLSNYDGEHHAKLASLLLSLLRRKNLREFLTLKIESECSIKHDNYANIVAFYSEFLNGLYELSKNDKIFLETLFVVVKKVYPYESEYNEYDGGRTLTFCRFVLPFNKTYEKLRNLMWEAIVLLHDNGFDDNKLNELVKYNHAVGEIALHKKYDSQLVINIVKNLDFSNPRDAVFAFSLLNQFYKYQGVKNFLNNLFLSDETRLYFDFVVAKFSNKYGNEYKQALIQNCFKKYSSTDNFVEMLSRFYKMYGQYNSWTANNIIAYAFEYLYTISKENYDSYLICFLSNNYDYSGNPCFLTSWLNNKQYFVQWTEQSLLKYRISFIASVLFNYKINEINDDLYNFALHFFINDFKKTLSGWGNENILSLKNFETFKKGFIYEVLKAIQVDKSSINFIEALFFVKESVDQIFEVLNHDFELFKRIYFGLLTYSRFYDYDGRITTFLLEKDPASLRMILDLIVDGKTDIEKIKHLYSATNFVETFIDIIVTRKFAHINFAISHCVEKMPNDIFTSLVMSFINSYKDNSNYMQEFSIIVEHRELESQVEFVDLLITNNVKIAIFEKMMLFGGPTSWTGSRIPYLNNNINAIRKYLNSKQVPEAYQQELERRIKIIEKNIKYEAIEEFNRGY